MNSRPFGLSPREFQVMELVCEGLDNASIGKLIGTSKGNACRRLECAVQKMGIEAINSRVAAAVKFDRAMRGY